MARGVALKSAQERAEDITKKIKSYEDRIQKLKAKQEAILNPVKRTSNKENMTKLITTMQSKGMSVDDIINLINSPASPESLK